MNQEAHMSNKTGLAQSQIKYVSAFELPLSYGHNSTNFLNRYSNLISPYSCLRAAYTILHYEMTDWKTNLPTNQQCHPLYNDLEKLFNWSTLEQADMGDKLGDEG